MPRLWFAPVEIWVAPGTSLTVNSVQQAARVLLEEWPAEHRGTDVHSGAMLVCLAALEGMGSVEDAREAFLAAAREAGMG